MKQTAMQELKWFISDGLNNFDESVKVSEIWDKVEELVEQEKQQIIDAWENGYEHGACVNEDKDKYHGNQYYKERFNGK